MGPGADTAVDRGPVRLEAGDENADPADTRDRDVGAGLSQAVYRVDVMTDSTYAAAWVPFEPALEWDEHAGRLAADWVREQADELGVKPVLVTESRDQQRMGPEVIRAFANTHLTVTRKGGTAGGYCGAVLAYVPDFTDMENATAHAHGYAMAVVEHPATPMIGWAMQTGALDLRTGHITQDTRTPAQITALKDLYTSGHNGWADDFGAASARQVLGELQAGDRPDPRA